MCSAGSQRCRPASRRRMPACRHRCAGAVHAPRAAGVDRGNARHTPDLPCPCAGPRRAGARGCSRRHTGDASLPAARAQRRSHRCAATGSAAPRPSAVHAPRAGAGSARSMRDRSVRCRDRRCAAASRRRRRGRTASWPAPSAATPGAGGRWVWARNGHDSDGRDRSRLGSWDRSSVRPRALSHKARGRRHATLTSSFNPLNLHRMDPEEPEPAESGPDS